MRIGFVSVIAPVLCSFLLSGCAALFPQQSKVETALAPEPKTVKKSEKPFHSLIAHYAAENGVPLNLAHAVVYSESTYRPHVTGAAGEVGLMQLRMATARMVGYSGSRQGLYDPETNIKYGMRYLGQAHKLGNGSTCGTILKYNAGHGAKRMNPISQRYCNKVRNLL